MDLPNPKRSFFEEEAERIAELNKHKNDGETPTDLKVALTKAIGWLIGAGIGIVVTLAILIPTTVYAIFTHGYVAMKLWQWFVIPAFNAQPITWLQAGGVMLLVRLFTYNTDSNKNKHAEQATMKENLVNLIGVLLVPWYTLLVGWLAHLWM